MAIPTFDAFIFPLLKLIAARPDGLRSTEAYDVLAKQFELTDEEREELLPSGRQRVFHNRILWAQDRLKRAGLSVALSRGLWQIAPTGEEYIRWHPRGPSKGELAALAKAAVESATTASGSDGATSDVIADLRMSSPDERIEAAVHELNGSLVADLLGRMREATPEFFERVVLDVLSAMGYGANRSALVRTGGPGDGGVDGVIALDRLGLEKVAVQAKRWKDGSKVGRPDVQVFVGALMHHHVRKGVFITTSSFTDDAVKFATTLPDPIILVDGVMLASLMIEHGVGVSVERVVKLARVDSDYFTE